MQNLILSIPADNSQTFCVPQVLVSHCNGLQSTLSVLGAGLGPPFCALSLMLLNYSGGETPLNTKVQIRKIKVRKSQVLRSTGSEKNISARLIYV